MSYDLTNQYRDVGLNREKIDNLGVVVEHHSPTAVSGQSESRRTDLLGSLR